jgi:hypothetical protein
MGSAREGPTVLHPAGSPLGPTGTECVQPCFACWAAISCSGSCGVNRLLSAAIRVRGGRQVSCAGQYVCMFHGAHSARHRALPDSAWLLAMLVPVTLTSFTTQPCCRC